MTADSGKLAAIVLAAGESRRMRSARAKVLHEVAGVTVIGRVLRAVAALGVEPLVVVVGRQAPRVEAAVRTALAGVCRPVFALQEEARGTGDAARCGLEQLGAGFCGDVLLVYGDMARLSAATLRAFVARHQVAQAGLSFASVVVDAAGAYGRVLRGAEGRVRAIVEARDASAAELAVREVNAGLYLGRVEVLAPALAGLQCHNAQGEYYLTDVVASALAAGFTVEAMRFDDAALFAGVNSREELTEMEAQIRREINRRLMAAGVTLHDPATTYIDETVEIGPDVEIGPNVQLLGRTRIGAETRIEGTAFLRDVEIGPRCHLKFGLRAEQCNVGEGCEIGPFAHLRPGTVLEGRNRVGNFVETKMARLGRNTKASHLSYLGDVVVGPDTNIGCGVITVNFDGFAKHPTRIGARCMVGCDSQLVAPVTVGDDVYVASGTTVLRDVGTGSLVMSEHAQRERPGWTAKWRRRHGAPAPAGSGRADAPQE